MKKTLIVLFASLFVGFASAQDKVDDFEYKSLFNEGGIYSHGGYGNYTIAYTQVGGNDAFMNGGSGYWLINHSIGIGGGGYSFNSLPKVDSKLNDQRFKYTGGYGGLMIEGILFPSRIVHLSFPVLIGAGGISYSQSSNYSSYPEDSQAYFVVEPKVCAEMNLVKYMRLALWVSYRYTSDIKLKYYTDGSPIGDKNSLRGLSGGITFKFGTF